MARNLQDEVYPDLEEVFQRSRFDWLGYQDLRNIFASFEDLTLSTEPVNPSQEGVFLYQMNNILDTVNWDLFDDGDLEHNKVMMGDVPIAYTIVRCVLNPMDVGVKSTLERRVYSSDHNEGFCLAHYRSRHTGGESEEDTDENDEEHNGEGDGAEAGDDEGDGAAVGDDEGDGAEAGDDEGDDEDAAFDIDIDYDPPPGGAPAAAAAASMTNVREKERKKTIKALKSHVRKMASDQFGSMNGRRPLLQLLHPNSSRYFSHDDLASLDLSIPSLSLMDKSETSSKTKDSDGKESGEEVKDEQEDTVTEHTDLEEDVTVAGGKKDPLLRRQELLVNSGLAERLFDVCVENAEEFLKSNFGKEVMYEERKKTIKAMKSHVGKMASDQFGSMVLAYIFSVADDTKLLTKIIVREPDGIRCPYLSEKLHELYEAITSL